MKAAPLVAVAALLGACASPSSVAPAPEDEIAVYLRRASSALSAARAGDEAQLQALLDAVEKSAVSEPRLEVLASFLHEVAVDRRRLKESAAAATARVRSERHAQEALRTRAEAAQERATQLQQKLDALSALEKSLSDRPSVPR